MRVLLTTPDFPPDHGGIQLLMGRLAATLAARHEVRTTTLGDPAAGGPPAVRVRRSPVHAADVVRLGVRTVAEGRRWRPDVVVCGHVVCGPAALRLGRSVDAPVVQWTHAKELVRRRDVSALVLRRADAVVAVSAHTAALCTGLGAPPARVHVVHPAVDAGPTPPPLLGRPGRDVVTVARLEDRYKGFDVLLRALPLVLAEVPEARWLVVGDGPLRPALERTARRTGLGDAVRFLGAVGDARRDAVLDGARVFAMPSRLPADGGGEGFGIVYLEAGAHGLPVVAGAMGGAVDAVPDGRSGLLVDPEDHLAVADALVALLTDDDLAARLGTAGRARAAERTWAAMGAEVEALLEGVRP